MGNNIQLKDLNLLNEIGKEFSSSLDLDSVIDTIMSRVKDVLECEASSVILYDEIKDSLVFYAASGAGAAALKGLSIPADSGVAGWVFTNRTPLMVGDTTADERF
jgi:GAF domain-containing protein